MRHSFIDRALRPINKFMHYENSGGILLFLSVIAALILANSPWRETFHNIWETNFSLRFGDQELSYSLHYWINDGLMAMFFFTVGLELKRELLAGELSSFRKAILPFGAAVGGMLVPALLYVAVNAGEPSLRGWGIPMATDIVFALSIITLAGKRVPISAKVFLVALATVDDLGAVLVIALFYSSELSMANLGIGFVLISVLVIANWMGVRNMLFYAIVGIGGVWLAFLLSGVHATIAGVLVAFTIPSRTKIDSNEYSMEVNSLMERFDAENPYQGPIITAKQHQLIEEIHATSRNAQTPLQKLEGALHPWVAFLVIPLFALSNAGVEIGSDFLDQIINPITVGIVIGLVVGKLVGVSFFTWLLVKLGIASLPKGVNWMHIIGVSLIAGVGFTMSLFITNLAFTESYMVDQAKYGILIASLIAGVTGFMALKRGSKRKNT